MKLNYANNVRRNNVISSIEEGINRALTCIWIQVATYFNLLMINCSESGLLWLDMTPLSYWSPRERFSNVTPTMTSSCHYSVPGVQCIFTSLWECNFQVTFDFLAQDNNHQLLTQGCQLLHGICNREIWWRCKTKFIFIYISVFLFANKKKKTYMLGRSAC